MTGEPKDLAFRATASCVLLTTGAALALIVYAVLAIVHLVPPSLIGEELVRLAY